MQYISTSENETTDIAGKITEKLRLSLAGQPLTIFLKGTLGAGKSVFARSMIRCLMNDQNLNVPSPTFTLVQHYDTAENVPVYHLDLYRLEEPEEILELGWDDMQAEGLCLIEWPERLGPYAPYHRIEITIETGGGDGPRTITINGEAKERLFL